MQKQQNQKLDPAINFLLSDEIYIFLIAKSDEEKTVWNDSIGWTDGLP